MIKKNKVLVVEDGIMFREFLVAWLRDQGFAEVVEAGTLAQARRYTEARDLDLVILDLELPDGDGLEFGRKLVHSRRDLRVLALTAHRESYPVLKLKRSMMMGMLDKADTSKAELQLAVDAVMSWRTYYSARVEETFRQLVGESAAFYKTLSEREERVLRLFGMGLSNGEVAIKLELSLSTVQGHRRNIMGKVGVNTTPELIVWAIRNGFVREVDFKKVEDREEFLRDKKWELHG